MVLVKLHFVFTASSFVKCDSLCVNKMCVLYLFALALNEI